MAAVKKKTKKKKVRRTIRKQGTRELSKPEHNQLEAYLSKFSVYRASRKCGVSNDVLIRMRNRDGAFHKASINKVLEGIIEHEKSLAKAGLTCTAKEREARTRNCENTYDRDVGNEKVKAEAVDHPEHYGGEANPYEAIKVIEAWDLNFNLGNTLKYIGRAGKKDMRVEDLKKAAWYLKRELSRNE